VVVHLEGLQCVLLQCCYVSSHVVLACKFIILRNWIEFLEFTE
jgi:hypothetical protein